MPSRSNDNATGASAPPLSAAELLFHTSVSRYNLSDGAREQQAESVCKAAVRCIVLGRPSTLPKEFLDLLDVSLDEVPSAQHSFLEDVYIRLSFTMTLQYTACA